MYVKAFIGKLEKLPISYRKAILISIDFLSIVFSLLVAKYVLEISNISETINSISKLAILSSTCLTVYLLTGQYKALTKYSSIQNIYSIAIRNLLVLFVLCLWDIGKIKEYIGIMLIINIIVTLNKNILSYILNSINLKKKKNIIIYGAGSAGAQLANSLKINNKYLIKLFIDDDKTLYERTLCGIRISNPSILKELENKIDIVYFCIPSINLAKRKKILNDLSEYSFQTRVVPSIDELNHNKITFNDARRINIEELIFRESTCINNTNVKDSYKNKVVCITGAGGSIGSELFCQISELKPKKIVLIDMSEYNLYKIQKDIIDKKKIKIDVRLILGNAVEDKFINKIFLVHNVNIVLHAAAYKHVPIVELNPLSGMKNNIISTKVICEAALKNKLEKCILISSDKAVRPTNLMGASKRVCEIIFKIYHKKSLNIKAYNQTIYASVRFGNVLGSSGSVVPLFKEQISKGGPITITHPNMIRYFMTIKEACILVMESTVLASGGETYLLDMGKPIKIVELARKMVKLSGLSVKERTNPEGDIEFKYMNLREGEKLYEELLVDGQAIPTNHNQIYESIENDKTDYKYLDNKISCLKNELKEDNIENSIKIMKLIVPEWSKSNKLVKEVVKEWN